MPVIKYDDMKMKPIEVPDAKGVLKALVIGKAEGWDDGALRVFRLSPGGFTPKHNHDWEHVNFVIGGRGRLTIDDRTYEIGEKDFAFVPPNAVHRFENIGEEDFEFICVVPERGEY